MSQSPPEMREASSSSAPSCIMLVRTIWVPSVMWATIEAKMRSQIVP
jgi:hypothetical protein